MAVELSGNVVGETLITTGAYDSLNETFSAKVVECMYKTRMMSYYPPVIAAIKEFQAIVSAECSEFETYSIGREDVLENAYLSTMNEDRVKQWEQILGITPRAESSLGNRRDTIIARIRGQGKLNTKLINSIVNAFTGGTAVSWVEDSTLYVEITPPPNNKQYQFLDVEQELRKKVPAHLNFQVSRNYYEWRDISTTYSTWGDLNDNFDTWEEVYLFTPFPTAILKG